MKREIISTKEASTLLGVGPTTVKRWADEGRIPSLRTAGGHRRFRRKDVLELLRESAQKSSAADDDLDRWIQLLISQVNLFAIQAALLEQRAAQGSWAEVADTLGAVLERIGERWRLGQLSIVQEHLATARLTRAIAACAAQIPVRADAPRCVLAMAERDPHTVGLSLAELCAREAGWSIEWVGAETPTQELLSWVEDNPVNAIAVSASRWAEDAESLQLQYSQLAAACREHDIALVLGGEGAWPAQLNFGHRIQSFTQFRDLLEELVSGEVHHVAS